jgi:drug/metabolite transporter (DMT)-like permease
MAIPFVLFPLAEQRIGSSLAGMLNAAAPLFTAVVATLVWHRTPGPRQRLGLLAGFAGVVVICWPSLQHARATATGVGLVILATVLYGVAFNLAAPLEARYGALPVIWRAELAALAMLAPFGIAAARSSSFGWPSLLAVAALGCLGTAAAFAAFAALAGRAGATRASVTVYFVPAIAVVFGAAVLSEPIALAAIAGTVLVTAGAYAVSRAGP